MRRTSTHVVCLTLAAGLVCLGAPASVAPAVAAESPNPQATTDEKSERPEVLSAHDRVAGFVRLWSEIKYNFAFFDQVPELDWDQVLDEYLPKVYEAQSTEQYYRLLQQCVARLKDGHTTVYLPSELRKRARLPLRLAMIEKKVIVTEAAPAALFAHPELKPGLEVTHLHTRPVVEILEQDIYPYVADSTRQNRDRHALRWLAEGDEGAKTTVRLRDVDGQSRELTLPNLAWQYPETPRFECLDLGGGMIYVALDSFSSEKIVSEFDRALGAIRKATGLILDVRNNGGGSSSIGYAIIGRLIDKPLKRSRWKTRQYMPAFRAWGFKERWHEGEATLIEPRTDTPYLGPIVLLIGPGTVSAAEDFVVALHAGSRATLIGQRTAGTTGEPLLIELPGGGKARICTKRDSYPDGREFVGIGVIPDVEIHPTQRSVAAGRDLALEKALKTLADKAGIDASVVSTKAVLERRRGTVVEDPRAVIRKALKRAKAEYDALTAAYERKDWRAVDTFGDNLADILGHELLWVFRLDQARERVMASGGMNEQTEYTFHRGEQLRRELEALLAENGRAPDVGRMIAEIEDAADEVHDYARDGQYDEIPDHFARLQNSWPPFWKRVVSKVPDLKPGT